MKTKPKPCVEKDKINTETKHPLAVAIVFFVCSLMFVYIFIVSVGYYKLSKISYEQLTYKEFTVESVREISDPDSQNMYYIAVVEDDKTIEINNLLTNAHVRRNVLALRSGDKIQCYVIEDSSHYKIVQLKAQATTILSLEEYREIHHKQGLGGMIVMPIVWAVMIGISIKSFVTHLKQKPSKSSE